MDGVLVDFQSGIDKLGEETRREYEGRLDEVPGIFSLMDPMPGAIEAVHELGEHYDMYILSEFFKFIFFRLYFLWTAFVFSLYTSCTHRENTIVQ